MPEQDKNNKETIDNRVWTYEELMEEKQFVLEATELDMNELKNRYRILIQELMKLMNADAFVKALDINPVNYRRFMCNEANNRYLSPEKLEQIVRAIPEDLVKIGYQTK